jgi:hypothetical protein
VDALATHAVINAEMSPDAHWFVPAVAGTYVTAEYDPMPVAGGHARVPPSPPELEPLELPELEPLELPELEPLELPELEPLDELALASSPVPPPLLLLLLEQAPVPKAATARMVEAERMMRRFMISGT